MSSRWPMTFLSSVFLTCALIATGLVALIAHAYDPVIGAAIAAGIFAPAAVCLDWIDMR